MCCISCLIIPPYPDFILILLGYRRRNVYNLLYCILYPSNGSFCNICSWTWRYSIDGLYRLMYVLASFCFSLYLFMFVSGSDSLAIPTVWGSCNARWHWDCWVCTLFRARIICYISTNSLFID